MRKSKMLTLASLLLIGSTSLAFAGPHHGGMGFHGGMGPHGGMGFYDGLGPRMDCMGYMGMDHRGGHMGMFRGIDLTQEQQQKMRDIMIQYRNTQMNQPLNPYMGGDLYNLIIADNFNEAQVRSQIEQRTKHQVDRGVQMAKMHHDLYQVLTPEQKAQAKSFHDQRMTQMKQRLDARAARGANNMPAANALAQQ